MAQVASPVVALVILAAVAALAGTRSVDGRTLSERGAPAPPPRTTRLDPTPPKPLPTPPPAPTPPGTKEIVPATKLTPQITSDPITKGVSAPAGSGASVSVGASTVGDVRGVGGSYTVPGSSGGATSVGVTTDGKSVAAGVGKTMG
jgi:hypothetical protein